MMPEDAEPVGRAALLRAEFDRAFALELESGRQDGENLLGLRIAGDAYAVRLAELSGLFADRKILHLPSPSPQLLGLSGLRGVVVPVYGLGALLGYAPAGSAPRWLIVAGASRPVALAFEHFDGYLRVPRAALCAAAAPARSHVAETVRTEDGPRALISIASLMGSLSEQFGQVHGRKEP